MKLRPQLENSVLKIFRWPLGLGLDEETRLIAYHSVGNLGSPFSISIEQFRRQMDWLIERNYRFFTLRDWWDKTQKQGKPPARSVVVTFDDGYQDVALNAAPLLARRGIPATVFLVSDFIGRNNDYDPPEVPRLPLMNWDQIKQLQKSGWDFQSHGRRHRRLWGASPEILEEELAGSKALLEAGLGKPVDFFCYPHGLVDASMAQAAEQAGYLGGVSCRAGNLSEAYRRDPYQLPRVAVERARTLSDFAARFSPAYSRLVRWRSWVRDV